MNIDAEACRAYGSLTEGVHIAGYTIERCFKSLEWLLDENRWQQLGVAFKDVNAFLDSVKFDKELRATIEQRKRIANRIRELQPEASNRAIARVMGVDEKSIRIDAAENSAGTTKSANKINGRLSADAENSAAAPSLSGAQVASLAERLETKEQKKADRRASALEAAWTPDQLDRKRRAEVGECVVASMRDNGNGQRADEALLNWAEKEGRLVRVDRQSDFGNPFIMPDDGDRADVIDKFEVFYWPNKPALLDQIATWSSGKVLVCWCHPERCHADVIAATANAALRGEGTPQEIADAMADHDG